MRIKRQEIQNKKRPRGRPKGSKNKAKPFQPGSQEEPKRATSSNEHQESALDSRGSKEWGDPEESFKPEGCERDGIGAKPGIERCGGFKRGSLFRFIDGDDDIFIVLGINSCRVTARPLRKIRKSLETFKGEKAEFDVPGKVFSISPNSMVEFL